MKDLSIGLAFSGGGARGIAHIGVLRALLEAGIHPTVVSGTSSGSIVATLYACGLSIDEIEAFAHIGSNLKILRLGNPLRGLMKLTLLREKLEAVLPVDDFCCTKHKLVVVTSDLQRGKVAFHEAGELITPVQASCAIPLIFSPILINGFQHIDGGLYMNLPADPIRSKVDFLIGSNVMPLIHQEVEPLSSIISISQRVFDLSINTTTAASSAKCDFLIEPKNIVDFNVYNFAKTDQLIKVGYEETLAIIPILKAQIEKRKMQNSNMEIMS